MFINRVIKIYSKKLKRPSNKDEFQNNNIIQKDKRRDSIKTNFILDINEIEKVRTEKKIDIDRIYTSNINEQGKVFQLKKIYIINFRDIMYISHLEDT